MTTSRTIDPLARLQQELAKTDGYTRGVIAAADVASQYNRSTSHPYRLDDCILDKLNVTKRKKPRKNTEKLPSTEDTLLLGFGLGLVEMLAQFGGAGQETGGAFCRAAASRGLTLKVARRLGMMSGDVDRLKRAGVK